MFVVNKRTIQKIILTKHFYAGVAEVGPEANLRRSINLNTLSVFSFHQNKLSRRNVLGYMQGFHN